MSWEAIATPIRCKGNNVMRGGLKRLVFIRLADVMWLNISETDEDAG